MKQSTAIGNVDVSRETSRRFLWWILPLALFLIGCGGLQGPEGWAAPVAVQEAILVQVDSGRLALINPENGGVRWRFPADEDSKRPFYATPLVVEDALYLADYEGRVTRVALSEGAPAEVWRRELDGAVVASPVLIGESLYVPTEGGHIAVLSTASGELERTIQTADRRIWGAPAVEDGNIYVSDLDQGSTLAFSASSGEELWEQNLTGPTAADLSAEGGMLLVGSFDRRLHALDLSQSGAERWAFDGDGWFLGAPVIEGDTVFAASMRGSVYALDRETGTQRWAFHLEKGEFRASPLLVDGHLVAISRDGRIVGLDPATGTEQWRHDVGSEGNLNANALARGTEIFLSTSRHDVYAVNTADGSVRAIPVVAD